MKESGKKSPSWHRGEDANVSSGRKIKSGKRSRTLPVKSRQVAERPAGGAPSSPPPRQWPPRQIPKLNQIAIHRLEWQIQGAESSFTESSAKLREIVHATVREKQFKLLLFDFVSLLYCAFLDEAKTPVQQGDWSVNDFSVYAGWFIADAAEGAFRKYRDFLGLGVAHPGGHFGSEAEARSYAFAHSELVHSVINSIRARQKSAELFARTNDGKSRTDTEKLFQDIVSKAEELSRPIDRGKFCDQVIEGMKRIKTLVVGTGRSMAEVQQDHPDLTAWKVRTELSAEDQEVFNRPRQWGPVVGYAKKILSKTHGVSTHTITSWVKAYNKDRKTKKA